MSGAVDVCIVSLCSLILDVRRVDGDTTLFLFGSLVDLIESNSLAALADSENAGDCSGQSGFAVVNVADGADVAVRFCSVKMRFCHCVISSLNNWITTF